MLPLNYAVEYYDSGNEVLPWYVSIGQFGVKNDDPGNYCLWDSCENSLWYFILEFASGLNIIYNLTN